MKANKKLHLCQPLSLKNESFPRRGSSRGSHKNLLAQAGVPQKPTASEGNHLLLLGRPHKRLVPKETDLSLMRSGPNLASPPEAHLMKPCSNGPLQDHPVLHELLVGFACGVSLECREKKRI